MKHRASMGISRGRRYFAVIGEREERGTGTGKQGMGSGAVGGGEGHGQCISLYYFESKAIFLFVRILVNIGSKDLSQKFYPLGLGSIR